MAGVIWKLTPIDHQSTRWQTQIPMVNATTRQIVAVPQSYIELATGLNYQDETGSWQRSRDLVELEADGGASGLYAPHRCYFPANLNTPFGITVTTISNRVFATRPLGIVYEDFAARKTVVVCPLRNCAGELLPPNQVLFRSAFSNANLVADFRATYTHNGYESDVVFLAQPAEPEAFGLSGATTRIQIWHEFEAPGAPQIRTNTLAVQSNAVLRASMTEPDLLDQTLDFGDLWFPLGKAVSLDGTEARDTNTAAEVRVASPYDGSGAIFAAKQWVVTTNGNYLIESIDWTSFKAKISSLPTMALAEPGEPAALRLAGEPRPPIPEPPRPAKERIRLAANPYHPKGFLWDYITVPSTGSSYVFTNGTTFYLPSSGYFSSTLTFQPGCILKFPANKYLLGFGGFNFNGTTASPSIFTSKDENLYGDVISGSTGWPTNAASQALWVYYVNFGVSVSNVLIRWANIGVEFDANTPQSHSFNNSAIQVSNSGLAADNTTVTINSSTECGVITSTTNLGSATFSGTLANSCSGSVSGIPDLWFITYLGSIGTATANPSGDGLNNLLDYSLGLNPSFNMIAQATNQALYSYTPAGWLTNAANAKNQALAPDAQGNLLQSAQ